MNCPAAEPTIIRLVAIAKYRYYLSCCVLAGIFCIVLGYVSIYYVFPAVFIARVVAGNWD